MRFRAANFAYFAVAFFGSVFLVNGMKEVMPKATYDSIVGISQSPSERYSGALPEATLVYPWSPILYIYDHEPSTQSLRTHTP